VALFVLRSLLSLFHRRAAHRDLRSFPTRRSSDLVVLSSRGDEAGKVQALDLGADDYLTKPFGMDELLARLRAALRHQLQVQGERDRKSTRLNSSHVKISYAVFCLKKKKRDRDSGL